VRPIKYLLLFGCVLFCACAGFAAEPQWVEVRSPNFSVITDAGEKRGRDVALRFEQMRAVFGTLVTKMNVNLSVPLQIVAFRNTKQIRQMSPLFNGKPTEVAGLFLGGEDRSYILLDMSVEDPFSVVFHEYAHKLMEGNLKIRTDAWFEEGFAEYFSSIEVDSKEARVGKIPEQTYLILQQLGMMKVTDLFRVQHDTRTYNESGNHRTSFYATSSLVVHYLYDNQLFGKLGPYFDALQLGKKPVEEAIQQGFGMSPAQFDKVLRNYLSSGRYRYYPIPSPPGIVPAQFTVTPVRLMDAKALLAEIHAHSRDYQEKAVEEFHEIITADPENTAALRGLGYAYLQKGDFEKSQEYLRKAAEHDSKDARVHFYYAMLLNRQSRDQATTDKIKAELETAIGLDPKLTEAYSLLGFAQATSGETDKGIETTKKAIELAPRVERYQFNLASIYLMSKKVTEAIAIFDSLAESNNPEIANRARSELSNARAYKAQIESPGLRLAVKEADDESVERIVVSQPVTETTGVKMGFVRGKLVAIDCSQAPQALLTVATSRNSKKLRVRDRAHVVLIGVDTFSCDWKDKSVAVNYRERTDGEGDVVSLEME